MVSVEEAFIAADHLARLLTNLKHNLAWVRFDHEKTDSEKMAFLQKRLAEAVDDILIVQFKIFGEKGE